MDYGSWFMDIQQGDHILLHSVDNKKGFIYLLCIDDGVIQRFSFMWHFS